MFNSMEKLLWETSQDSDKEMQEDVLFDKIVD